MKPLKLFITAFGPYAATEVVDFRRAVDAGLFGIYGPTGSGKTSIFSAMAFALFGEGARHEQPTTSMRSGHAAAQTLTEVAFLFELGGKRYFVRRQPEQKRPRLRGEGETDHVHTAYLFDATDIEVDDVTVDNCGTVLAEKRVGVVNERIREVLGYDIEQFRQIVLLPQGHFERFLASDSKARLEILRGLFDVSLYERMTESLKAKAADARTTYQQGMLLHVQQLTNAGFASTDDLTSAIGAAEGRCVELDAGAATADATRAAAVTTLANGETLQKCFDEAGAAAIALTALQGRETEMDALRERHKVAGCAAQLVDRDDVLTRAVTALVLAKDAETIAARRVTETLEAEATAMRSLEHLKTKVGEIDTLKRQISDLDRYATVLTDAADLKAQAEKTEGLLVTARAATATARKQAEGATQTLVTHRANVDRAHATQSERLRLTAERDRIQRLARHAREVERARTALETAEGLLTKAQCTVADARLRRSGLETAVRDRQAEFIAGQARLLAESLESGSPCAVCGSVEHPQPAHGGEPAAGLEAAWREAQVAFDSAATDAQTAESAFSAAASVRDERRTALEALDAPEGSAADLEGETLRLGKAIEALGAVVDVTSLVGQTVKLEGNVTTADAERSSKAEVERSAGTAAALARQSYNDHIAAVPESLHAAAAITVRRRSVSTQIDERELEIQTAQDACTQTSTDRAAAESDRTGAAKRITECDQDLTNARSAYVTRRDELGLTDEQYRTAKADIANIATLFEQLDTFRENLTRAQSRVDDTSAAIAGREQPNLELFRADRDAAQAAAATATRAAADARAGWNQLNRLLESLREQMERLALLNEQSGPLRDLADAFEGRNAMNITLETYAVGAMFDQVLEAANLRFGPMSQGRYRLERDVQTVGGRGKRGLDIRVHDIQTGRAREVTTLSGGETFIAALALALGLSDIVEMTHGAIRLDTIFIDEGFGSLDSDSDGGTLDQVLQVLQDIVGQRRAVGLISHVPLVQQAVPNGFAVIKTPSGSRIEERIV
ncbi:AAA family ATPase [Sphingomonas sp. Leaf37]|uniref:AAA family ATPase n=1 Tax=Sphingomonas sp. Leaf37 TaxID=2876552 RepID=UPI001E31FB0E|nr:SMC family ATPase [Sphingomonas sp. Leaf37]